MKTQNMIPKAVITVLLSTLGVCAWAQSTTSVVIPLNAKSYEKLAGEDMARVNLINEAKKVSPTLKNIPNLEVQMIRLEAKSGMGGSQVFLRINNEMVDSQSIETDPDQLETQDALSFQRVELKNIDRSLVNEASLVIQAFSNTRIRSLELVLGPVQEPVVFGHYADEQIAGIGGSVTSAETEGSLMDVLPSADVVNQIYQRHYYQDGSGAPLIVDTTYPQATYPSATQPSRPILTQPVAPQPPARQCVTHKTEKNRPAYDICVGDTVKNSWGFKGLVQSVNVRSNQVTAKFDFNDSAVTRDVDSFSK